MLLDVINKPSYAKMMQRHIEEVMLELFKQDKNFGILCKIDYITFEPDLPEDIKKNFSNVTMFFLAGYTYESAKIEDSLLTFEAGFGSENIGSVVSVPLLSIIQIVLDETPIFVNLSDPIITFDKEEEQSDNNGVQNSMASFLSNPENKKFLKK